jgi:hypothetical protein
MEVKSYKNQQDGKEREEEVRRGWLGEYVSNQVYTLRSLYGPRSAIAVNFVKNPLN